MNEFTYDIENLRKIIQGLKISGFSHVNQEAVTGINQMIAKLPSPEKLLELANNKKAIKNISNFVGEILNLIEVYSKRGAENALREIAVKNMPPRYKSLNWRNDMSKNTVASKIRDLVKVSSAFDKAGKEVLATKTLLVANKLQAGSINENELNAFLAEINAGDNGKIVKEAFLGNMISRGLGNVSGFEKAISQKFDNAIAYLDKMNINAIATEIDKLAKQMGNKAGGAMRPALAAFEVAKNQMIESHNAFKTSLSEAKTNAVQALQNLGSGNNTATVEDPIQIDPDPVQNPATSTVDLTKVSDDEFEKEAIRRGWAEPSKPAPAPAQTPATKKQPKSNIVNKPN